MATAMAKMNYYFSNQNGIIFSGSMPDVKGSQMSDERASDAALKKMADSVKTTFTQQLETEFLKNNNEYEKILPY
jgi:fatty acid/phospholipid biosynthesis enzyme